MGKGPLLKTKELALGGEYPMVAFGAAHPRLEHGIVVVVGYYRGDLAIGQLSVKAIGDYDGFVAKLSPSGEALVLESFGGADLDLLYSVDTDADGNVGLCGYFRADISVGETSYLSAGDRDLLFAKLDPTGQVVWSRSFGDESMQRCYEARFDSQGNLVASGTMSGKVAFDDTILEANAATAVFVTKFGAQGEHRFSRRLGGYTAQWGYGMALDSRDRIVVTGFYEGAAFFGDLDPLPAGAVTEASLFVAKLDPNGEPLWSRGVQVSGNQKVSPLSRGWRKVAVDGQDRIVIGGYVLGAIDFGDGPSEGFGAADAFVAQLQP